MTSGRRHVRVLVIGAGFGGLGAAIRLEMSGRDDFVVLERGDSVGGTWRDNTYPGAQCDVPSHLYAYSFELNPDWSRSYSGQTEIHAYLQRTASRNGVMNRVVLACTVTSARWDGDVCRWIVETSKGRWTADLLVSAMGALSAPAVPDIPGLDAFRGAVFHSAQWPADTDLSGLRVAVVGTGASAVQIVPALVDRAARVDIYQRTPAWVMPRGNRAYSAWAQWAFRTVPGCQRVFRVALNLLQEAPVVAFTRRPAQLTKPIRARSERHLAHQVKPPPLQRKLTPDYTIGCKRILISNAWYPALQRPNVELVTDGIARVQGGGITSNDGTIRDVDAIVLATGFRVTDSPAFKLIVGPDGLSLGEVWLAKGMQAYKGSVVAGFPNLFLLMGPNTGLGHNSVISMIEAQLNYLLDALRVMDRDGVRTFEVSDAAQHAYNERLQRKLAGTVWLTGCRSWYLDPHGRNTTMWPGSTGAFRRLTRRFDPAAYYRDAPSASGVNGR